MNTYQRLLVVVLCLSCTSAHGQTLQWAETLFSTSLTQQGIIPAGIKLDRDSSIIIAGTFMDTVDFDPGPETLLMVAPPQTTSVFIAKYTADGRYVWVRTMDGTTPNSHFNVQAMTLDAADNLYLAGSYSGSVDFDAGPDLRVMTSTSSSDMFITRYAASGTYGWTIPVAGSGIVRAVDIAVDDVAGGIYVAGYFEGTADFDPESSVVSLTTEGNGSNLFFAKYSSAAECLFAYKVQSDAKNVYISTHASLLLVASKFKGSVDFNPSMDEETVLTSTSEQSIFFAQYDRNGKYVFANSIDKADFGSTGSWGGNSIAIDPSGNLFLCGPYYGSVDFDPSSDSAVLTSSQATAMYIAKYNSFGEYLWAKSIDVNGGVSSCFAVGADGFVYVGGYFYEEGDFDPDEGNATLTPQHPGTGTDMFIAKYSNNGNYVAAKNFGGYVEDVITDVALDHSGNAYLYGRFKSDSCDFDLTTDAGLLRKAQPKSNTYDLFLTKYSFIPSVVEDVVDNDLIYLYPNPASNTLMIRLPATPTAVEISNLLGERIQLNTDLSTKLVIDVKGLRKGLYTVTAVVKERNYRKVFVIE